MNETRVCLRPRGARATGTVLCQYPLVRATAAEAAAASRAFLAGATFDRDDWPGVTVVIPAGRYTMEAVMRFFEDPPAPEPTPQPDGEPGPDKEPDEEEI